MFGSKRAVRRFSLLLLDEGESYVKDLVASCEWPSEVPGNLLRAPKIPGQLRLCTRSLFFEPDDLRIPIVRLPFSHLQGLEGGRQGRFSAAAHRVVRMKPNAADMPYAVDREAVTTWEFELAYAGLEEFMPLAQQMLLASRLPPSEQEEFLEAFLLQQESGLHFDAGHLRSPSLEAIALELPAALLTPLVREPGRVVVTDARLYFQPQHNITGDAAVSSHPLPAVAAVARRRSSLRDVGVEIFFMQPSHDQNPEVAGPFWCTPSAFFAFKTREERETFVGAVMGQPSLGAALPGGRNVAAACGSIMEAESSWLRRVTAAWQRGRVSNLEYLLFLNLAAGRSFNDLTQYPVFPWVLADYTSPQLDLDSPDSFRDLSKPVGALNPVRLAMLQRRYAEMPSHDADPPFLFGTHYSCPGYVMFWLVRAAPAHMLRLQNGRFDAPDRLFCSLKESWESVLANPTDVKELIPEFFMQRTDFLLNRHKLPLGSRQSGKPVGDVELPAWAGGSPERFLEGQRAALEAPLVSANLHHWIDLIFGYQQQGQAAVEANNVFRHITYEGAVDTEAIADRVERQSLQTQVNEFGQCPRQLFRAPHPPRLVCPRATPLSPCAAASGVGSSPGLAEASSKGLGSSSGVGLSNASLRQGSGAIAAAAAAGAEGGGQALSLALVSTLVAAATEREAPPPLEVPPLLQQLDVVRQREEQERRELQQHGPIVSRATVIVEEFDSGCSLGSARSTSSSSLGPQTAAGSSATVSSPSAATPYNRFRSWASEAKLGERLGAIKGAVGEVVAAPAGERGNAIRGLFKRGTGVLAGQPGQEQAGSAEEEQALASRAASATAAEGQAQRPTSPQGARQRPASFTASLSQRFQSLTATLSPTTASAASPSRQQPGAVQTVAAASSAAEAGRDGGGVSGPDSAAGETAGDQSVTAGQDVLSGLMRWKYSSRQPLPPEDSSDEDEPSGLVATEGTVDDMGAVAPGAAAGKYQLPVLQSDAALGSLGHVSNPYAIAEADQLQPHQKQQQQQHPVSPRERLLEAQRQRMLRERAASPPGDCAADTTAHAAAQGGAEGYSGLAPPGTIQRQRLWGPGLRERLRPGRVFAAGSEAINAVALAEGGGHGSSGAVYCGSSGGALKVFGLHTGDQVRSAQISPQPLTSLLLVPSHPAHTDSSSSGTLPLALCGSYDMHVYAYSAALGRTTGSFQAHNDAVSCLAWLGDGCVGSSGEAAAEASALGSSSGSKGRLQLASGSWDASVKVWDLGEGRQPWGSKATGPSGSPALVITLSDLPGGVWALAASTDGKLLLSGTEDGHVTAWDLASGTKAWEQPLSQDYIGGLQFTPDGSYVVVAAADGNLSLLDVRRGGSVLSCVACGPPLRCCATDGEVAVAGTEDGTVLFWDVAQQRGRVAASSGTWIPPGPDGLYEGLRSSPPSPINALAASCLIGGAGGRAPAVQLVTGHEGGVVRAYTATL